MSGAGKLDRRIVIQRNSPTTNDFNEPIPSYSTYVARWASYAPMSDGETVAAGMLGSFLGARFVVRSDTSTKTITPNDQIVFETFTWNVKAAKETLEGRNRFIEITAVRDADKTPVPAPSVADTMLWAAGDTMEWSSGDEMAWE